VYEYTGITVSNSISDLFYKRNKGIRHADEEKKLDTGARVPNYLKSASRVSSSLHLHSTFPQDQQREIVCLKRQQYCNIRFKEMLPRDNLVKIFSHLGTPREVVTCLTVCRFFADAASEPYAGTLA
jgi:hypothetical protein